MKTKLVVVTDLGCFKAYRMEQSEFASSPKLDLIEEFDLIAGHKKLSEQTTDQAGRFPKGATHTGVIGDMGAGERHNIELEQRRRLIKQVAERLNVLLKSNGYEICFFAAGKEINGQILDLLEPQARERITKNLSCNLTKSDKSEIIKHFTAS